ncbi:MAG: hypothetical protein QMD17_03010 [Rhodocyclaceae bacterium]|nr:hypothetical protein [Rhodocyclaceae bacterium]
MEVLQEHGFVPEHHGSVSSTPDAIFSLDNGMATARIKGLGGALLWRDGALHALDPVQGLYVKATFPAAPQ